MAQELVLEVESRERSSKNAVRRLRRSGRIPGIVYGADRAPTPISIANNDVVRVMQNSGFFSQIIDLKLQDLSQQVLVRDMQRHPSSDRVLHIDFLRIREDQVVQISIPIRLENESRCVGVRLSGGLLARNLVEVEVSCLPRNLPEFLSVDVVNLDVNESVHLSDIELPEGVSIVNLMYGDDDSDRDIQVVSVQPPRLDDEDGDTDEFGEEEAGLDDESDDATDSE
ncbi:MAG: 50S ribosomal protein L25/general stress protein Ctc [Gammaproteobacteria bacterium]|nr:50S ribosomal protein L25/general stress protein Ctc [Gammaproteobacteria bacterium]